MVSSLKTTSYLRGSLTPGSTARTDVHASWKGRWLAYGLSRSTSLLLLIPDTTRLRHFRLGGFSYLCSRRRGVN